MGVRQSVGGCILGAILALGSGAALAAGVPPVTLAVAAAANLADVIQPIDAAFLAHHPGVAITVSSGASGNFYAQIKNGAPFDVFVSADMDFPRKLVAEGDATADTLVQYTTGELALWTTNPAIDPGQGLPVVLRPEVHKLAIANVDTAPYGRAAKAALESAGLWAQVQDKLVTGENIAQTAQFVQTGSAEVGLVALSTLKSPVLHGVGRYWILPQETFPPIAQGAVVTRIGATNPVARSYVDFLVSPEAAAIFDRFGYARPGPPPR